MSAESVRLLALDVDGVLTDGGLYVGEDGRHWKRFHFRDGLGIKVIQEFGVEIAIVSGHTSNATESRLRGLGVQSILTGVQDKGRALRELSEARGLARGEVAAMGDDWNDLSMFAEAGFCITVPDAPNEVREKAHLITRNRGGDGAVREAIEHLLRAQGRLEWAIRSFLR